MSDECTHGLRLLRRLAVDVVGASGRQKIALMSSTSRASLRIGWNLGCKLRKVKLTAQSALMMVFARGELESFAR